MASNEELLRRLEDRFAMGEISEEAYRELKAAIGARGTDTDTGGAFLTVPNAHSARPVHLELPVGELLNNRFALLDKLGEGRFGAVYLAEDQELNQRVALKVASCTPGQEQPAADQLRQELRVRRPITDNRHVIQTYDIHIADYEGRPLILMAMEYAELGSLRVWLTENRDNEEKRRMEGVELFKQACLGVQAIHDAGNVHLDLKPENLLLCRGDEGRPVVKVSDLGIARNVEYFSKNPSSVTHTALGTPAYMSPEQFLAPRAKDVRFPSDVYSLGVILFEILDGDRPFHGRPQELREKHATLEPPSLRDVDSCLTSAVRRCLAKKPEERFENLSVLLRVLDGWAPGEASEPAELHQRWLAIARDTACSIQSSYTRYGILVDIARGQAETGDKPASQKTFQLARSAAEQSEYGELHSAMCLAAMADAQVDCGDASGALATIERANACMAEASYTEKMECCLRNNAVVQAKAGQVAAAQGTVSKIKRVEARIEALGGIVMRLAAAGRTEEGLQLLKHATFVAGGVGGSGAQKTEPFIIKIARIETVVAMTKGQAERGNLAEARATASKIVGDSARSKAFLSIVEHQLKAGDLAGIDAVLAQITEEDCTISALCAIAEVRFMAGDVVRCREALEEAKATSERGFNECGRADRLRRIALLQWKTTDVAGARQTVQEAKALLSQVEFLDTRAAGLAEISVTEAEMGLVANSRETGNEAKALVAGCDESFGALARTYACKAEAKRADVTAARSTAAQIPQSGGRPEALALIARIQAEAGDVDGAKVTAAQIDRADHEASTFQTIAEIQARAGDATGARATVSEMMHTGWKAEALLHVLEEVGSRANTAWLLDWLDSLVEPELKAYAYLGAATGLAGLETPRASGERCVRAVSSW